jgi:hypothetical protein
MKIKYGFVSNSSGSSFIEPVSETIPESIETSVDLAEIVEDAELSKYDSYTE